MCAQTCIHICVSIALIMGVFPPISLTEQYPPIIRGNNNSSRQGPQCNMKMTCTVIQQYKVLRYTHTYHTIVHTTTYYEPLNNVLFWQCTLYKYIYIHIHIDM